MAKLRERELKVLSALSQLTEPTRPTEIGQLIGEIPLNTGRALTELEKGGLAVQTDEEQNLWAVTDTGRDYLEKQKQSTVSQALSQESVTGTAREAQPEATVPSQADIFRAEGQRLGIGSRKGDIRLDTIVTYVERIADLDDLKSVSNALTEMGVANDVKRRWIKLYAQNLPGKEIPEELKEKLGGEEEERKAKYSVDTGTGVIKVASTTDKTALTWDEAEKLSKEIKKDIEAREKKEAKIEAKEKAEAKVGEEDKESPFIQGSEGNWMLNPKAKVSGMELLAFETVRSSQEKGAKLDPFEVMLDRAKDMEMMRSVFGGGKEGGGFLDSIEDLVKIKTLLGTDEETKQLLAGIYKSIKEGGEGKGESEDVKALREEVKGLRDDLAKKDREKLDEQISSLGTALSEVRADLARARSDARATDEYGIMSEGIKMVDRRLGAIEGTVRGVLGRPPGALPPGVKKEITEAISEETLEEEALDRLAKEVLYQH